MHAFLPPLRRIAALPRAALLCALVVIAAGCAPAPPPAGAPPPPARPGAAPRAAAPAPPSATAAAPDAPITQPAAAPPPAPFRSDERFDLVIRGGEVIDGEGGPRRRADVLVRGDRVAFVGDVDPSVAAARVIDASGAVVAPGFIDAHAHVDPKGNVEMALAMGVTTVVVGQDGGSADRVGAWLNGVAAARPRLNVATLVGHATARHKAGLGAGNPTPAQLARLRAVVDQALADGAFGLSTGLEYDGGRGAGMDELVAAAEPVGARGGVVMSHLRSEDDDRIDASLDELLEQCRRSGARAHVAHVKVVLGRGAARAEEILARLEAARRAGAEVTADIYPYTASYTTIGILFPDFARPPQSYADAMQRRRADIARHLRERVTKRNGPEATLFGTGALAGEKLAGRTLAEVAAKRGVPFEDVLLDLGPDGAAAAYFVMDEALMQRLLVDPRVMIGTDGGGGGHHPRGYGAFARVLEEMVGKRGALTLEEAVRKMTSLPARTLRLDGERGCLRAGCAADVVVFAPGEVRARADFVAPHRLAEGMRFVVVNGAITREGPKATAARAGRALRMAARAR